MTRDGRNEHDQPEADPLGEDCCGNIYPLRREHFCTRKRDHEGDHANSRYEWPAAPRKRIAVLNFDSGEAIPSGAFCVLHADVMFAFTVTRLVAPAESNAGFLVQRMPAEVIPELPRELHGLWWSFEPREVKPGTVALRVENRGPVAARFRAAVLGEE